jgi:hypothetical protein
MTPTLRTAATGYGVRGLAAAYSLRRHHAGPGCLTRARQTVVALLAQLAARRSPGVVPR